MTYRVGVQIAPSGFRMDHHGSSRRAACDAVLRAAARTTGGWAIARVRRELGRIIETAGPLHDSHYFVDPTTGESFALDFRGAP